MRPYKSVPMVDTSLGSISACATPGDRRVFLGCSSGLCMQLTLPESWNPQQLVQSSTISAKCQIFPLPPTASSGFSALRSTVAALRSSAEPAAAAAVTQLLAGVPPLTDREVLAISAAGEVALIDAGNWTPVGTEDAPLSFRVLAKHAFAVASCEADPSSVLVVQRRRLLQLQRQGDEWQPVREVPHPASSSARLVWLGRFAVVSGGESDGGAASVVVVDMETGQLVPLPSPTKAKKDGPGRPARVVASNDQEEIFIASEDPSTGGTMGLFLNVRTTQTAPKPLFCRPHLYTLLHRAGCLIAAANTADELELLSCGNDGATLWQSVSLPAPVTAVAAFRTSQPHLPVPFVVCTQSTVWCLLPVPWEEQVRKLAVENRFADALTLVCMASDLSERRERFELVNSLAFWRYITAGHWALAFKALRLCPMQLPVVATLMMGLWRSQLPGKLCDGLMHWRNAGRMYAGLAGGSFIPSSAVAKPEDLQALGLTFPPDATVEAQAGNALQHAHAQFLKYLLQLRISLTTTLLSAGSAPDVELHRGLDVVQVDAEDSEGESAFAALLTGWRDILQDRQLSGFSFPHLATGAGLTIEQRQAGTLLVDLGLFLLLVDSVVVRLSITLEEMEHGIGRTTCKATAPVWALVEPSGKQLPHTKYSCFSVDLLSKAGAEIAADVVSLAAGTVCFRVWREQALKDPATYPLTAGRDVALKNQALDLARHSAAEANWATALSNCRCDFEGALRGNPGTAGKDRSLAWRWAAALLNLCCVECQEDDGQRRQTVLKYLPPLLRWDSYVGLLATVVVAIGSLPVAQQQLHPGDRVVKVCNRGDHSPILTLEELLGLVHQVDTTPAAEELGQKNVPLIFLLLARAGAKAPGKVRGGPPLGPALSTRLVQMLMRQIHRALTPAHERQQQSQQSASTVKVPASTPLFTRPQLVALLEVDREVLHWADVVKQARDLYQQAPVLQLETAICIANAEGLPAAVRWLVKDFEPERMVIAEALCLAANHGVPLDGKCPDHGRQKVLQSGEQVPPTSSAQQAVAGAVGVLMPPYMHVAALFSMVDESGEANDSAFWTRMAVDWRDPALGRVASTVAQRQAAVQALRSYGTAAASQLLDGQPEGFDVLAGEPVGLDALYEGHMLTYVKALLDSLGEASGPPSEEKRRMLTSVLQKYSTHPDLKLSVVLPLLPNDWSLRSVLPFMVRSCAAESAARVERAALARQAALAFLHTWAAVESAKRRSFLVAREDVCDECSKRLSVSRQFAAQNRFVWHPVSRRTLHVECCAAASSVALSQSPSAPQRVDEVFTEQNRWKDRSDLWPDNNCAGLQT